MRLAGPTSETDSGQEGVVKNSLSDLGLRGQAYVRNWEYIDLDS